MQAGRGSCRGRRERFELAEIAETAAAAGRRLEYDGHSSGTPRSVAFNVQGFEAAVHRRYGEIRVLRSIHAADAGVVVNPMQCRGQIEGGVAQAIGAALYERLVIDADGRVANPTFRFYHIPAFADVPQTEVYFATTVDRIGPLGAKSMSESPYNPIAAALANAIRDATGLRLYETPFMADELYRALVDRDAVTPNAKRPRPATVRREFAGASGRRLAGWNKAGPLLWSWAPWRARTPTAIAASDSASEKTPVFRRAYS